MGRDVLDKLADLLHSADRSLFMCSVHVGSMGGVMAVKRREAHVAGVRLLNEKDGRYNLHVIKKHFPRGGGRQGLHRVGGGAAKTDRGGFPRGPSFFPVLRTGRR